MYVTVTTTKGPPDQPRDIARIAGEEMLPWLGDIDGFEGLVMLTDEANVTALAISFWRDREVARQHEAARVEFRDRVTTAVNVTVEDVTDYEVSFVHLGPRLRELQA